MRDRETATQNYSSLSHLITQLGREVNLSEARRLDPKLAARGERVSCGGTNSSADK